MMVTAVGNWSVVLAVKKVTEDSFYCGSMQMTIMARKACYVHEYLVNGGKSCMAGFVLRTRFR